MKKIKRMGKVLTCLCTVMLTGILAAGCGKDDGKEFKTVGEYVETYQEQVAGLEGQFSGSNMTLDIIAEENKLVYIVRYAEQIEVNEDIKAYFQTSMEEQKETFTEALTELKQVVSEEDISIIYRYLNADGTEIYTYEVK